MTSDLYVEVTDLNQFFSSSACGVSVNLLHCLIRVTAPDQLLQLRIKTLVLNQTWTNVQFQVSRVTLTVSWLLKVSSKRINICGGGFLHLCSRTLLNMCYEYERTQDHHRGLDLPWRCCVLPGHHSCRPSCDLPSGSSKNARQILPALWRRPETHKHSSEHTVRAHTQHPYSAAHFCTYSLKGLTVLCGRGSTVITMWSLKVRITVSSKAGLFPAVTHTTCLYAQMYITEKSI